MALGQLVVGLLSDRFGAAASPLIGMVAFTPWLVTAVCALAPTASAGEAKWSASGCSQAWPRVGLHRHLPARS